MARLVRSALWTDVSTRFAGGLAANRTATLTQNIDAHVRIKTMGGQHADAVPTCCYAAETLLVAQAFLPP